MRRILAVAGISLLLYSAVTLSCRGTQSSVQNTLPSETTAAGIRGLVKQTARWSLAAQQDDNPMIGVLHANYGVGYWNALRSLASLERIASVARINPQEFETRILNVQARATRTLLEACPAILPPDRKLTLIAQGSL